MWLFFYVWCYFGNKAWNKGIFLQCNFTWNKSQHDLMQWSLILMNGLKHDFRTKWRDVIPVFWGVFFVLSGVYSFCGGSIFLSLCLQSVNKAARTTACILPLSTRKCSGDLPNIYYRHGNQQSSAKPISARFHGSAAAVGAHCELMIFLLFKRV